MALPRVPARAARDWLTRGLDRLLNERERWGGAALVYLLSAILLHRLPFLGDLLLILLTPLALGGLLLTAEHEATAPPVPFARARWRQLARAWLLVPASTYARLLRDTERLLPVLMLGVLALGGYVVAQILGHVLIGGTPGGGLGALGLSGTRAALVLPFVAAVYALFVLALYHSTALIVFDAVPPPLALIAALRGAVRHGLALLLFSVVFLIAYAVIAGAFGLSRLLGYPLLLALGGAALALFLPAARASFETLYRPRPANHPV